MPRLVAAISAVLVVEIMITGAVEGALAGTWGAGADSAALELLGLGLIWVVVALAAARARIRPPPPHSPARPGSERARR